MKLALIAEQINLRCQVKQFIIIYEADILPSKHSRVNPLQKSASYVKDDW